MVAFALLVGLLFIAVVVVLGFLAAHNSRIRRLEGLMGSLDTRVREALDHTAGTRSIPADAKPTETGTPTKAISETLHSPEHEIPPAAGQRQPSPSIVLPPSPKSPPFEVPKPSRTRGEWEALIGGKLLNRIGALALIIAMGLFLKYAFDNDWLREWMRVSIGLLIGAVCLFVAARAVRKGFGVFAQGLVGAGLAILYITVYASFNLYVLVSQPFAFAAMSAVTIIAYHQAFRYNSLSVSLLGLLGGFLTPFLLNTGEANMTGLFTYVAVLDLGLLMVVARKDTWMILEPLALLGTYIIYALWYTGAYEETQLVRAVVFLSTYWVLFHGFDLYRIQRGIATFVEPRRWTSGAHTVMVCVALAHVFVSRPVDQFAAVSLIAGLLYVGSALYTLSQPLQRGLASGQFMVTGILLSLAAVIIRFEGFTEIIIFSATCLLMIWLGLRKHLKPAWATGLILIPSSILMLLQAPGALDFRPLAHFHVLLNERALTFAVVAVCLGLAGRFYRTMAPKPSERVYEFFQFGWLGVCVLGLCLDTNDLFRFWMMDSSGQAREHLDFQRFMAIAGVTALAGLPLVGYALGARLRPIFFGSLWLLVGAAGLAGLRGLWYSPTEAFVLLFNLRVAVFLILAFGFAGVTKMLETSPRVFTWEDEFREITAYVPVILLLILFSAESWDFFKRETLLASPGTANGGVELTRLRNLQQLTLSSVWLVFSIMLMLYGLLRRDRGRRLLAIGLFGIGILKVFIYDLSFLDTLYRIFSFVGLGLILLAVSYLYQRYRDVILGNPSGAVRS